MATVEVGDPVTADLLNLLLNPPVCKLVAQSAQSMADATAAALVFGAGSEEIDTHSFHDETTNNTRITPTVAGVYWFDGEFFIAQMTQTGSAASALDFNFRKNGSTTITPGSRHSIGIITANPTSYTWPAHSQNTGTYIECNGTTDYVEMMGRQDSNGAVNTNLSSQFSSVFQCHFVRSSL